MKFTIFTGCYNSSNFIDRVFKSLKSQEYKNFEWIVIDDASKDDTVKLLYLFKNKNPRIDIKIIELKKNAGVAENRRRAINMAKGDFFVTWDHDDIQLPNQLAAFLQNWKKFKSEKVANIFGFCQDQNAVILGEQYPNGNHVSNYFIHYRKYFMTNIVKQEKHVCTRVNVIKKYINYSFPEGRIRDGEMLWAKIALEYDSIFINDIVRTYYIEDSNQHNMSSKTRLQMSQSVYWQKTIWVNYFLKALKHEPILYLRLIFAQVFYGFLSKKPLMEILSEIKNINHKVLALNMVIPAKLLIWKMEGRGKGL